MSNEKIEAPRQFGRDGVVKVHRLGLMVDPTTTVQAWKRAGQQLAAITSSSAWWFGDWLIYGEAHFPQRYRKAVEDTGLDYQTLRNYAWVARRFPLSRRRDNISFAHHMEVSKLAEPDQELWLDRTVSNRWSRNELRRQLKLERHQSVESPSKAVAPLRVVPTAEQKQRWLDAARQSRSHLDEWIITALDQAAVNSLSQAHTTSALT